MTKEAAHAEDFEIKKRNLSSCHELWDLGDRGMKGIISRFSIGLVE